jgi:hypothetical protein
MHNPQPATPSLHAAADLQIPFVENKGQDPDPSVAYVADTFACRVGVTRDGRIIYSLARDEKNGRSAPVISERIASPGKAVKVGGRDPRKARVSYFKGRDPSKWQRGLQSYGRLELGRAAPGIRAELKAHGRNVEKIFYVRPGANPAAIRLAVQGAKNLRINPQGELELAGASGSLRFTRPVAYQHIDGQRVNVPVRYTVSQNTYGFALGDYDRSKALVIDPLIRVFAYRPGDGFDAESNNAFMDVAADVQGNIYAAGYTRGQLAIFKLDRRLENLSSPPTSADPTTRPPPTCSWTAGATSTCWAGPFPTTFPYRPEDMMQPTANTKKTVLYSSSTPRPAALRPEPF